VFQTRLDHAKHTTGKAHACIVWSGCGIVEPMSNKRMGCGPPAAHMLRAAQYAWVLTTCGDRLLTSRAISRVAGVARHARALFVHAVTPGVLRAELCRDSCAFQLVVRARWVACHSKQQTHATWRGCKHARAAGATVVGVLLCCS
jgi:hypothetical protein